MSADFTVLRPLKSTILFQFMDEVGGAKGRFHERSKSGLIIPVMGKAQTESNRWGRVVAIGPDVQGIAVGEFILVAAQKWTTSETWQGEKVWKTVDIQEAVICVTDDEASTVTM
jgi:co-chaperonin GroES (HSP10)